VLGGGFGGAYAAQSLIKSLGPEWEIVLIDRNNYLLFYPLLIEAGVGTIEPRQVVVPLRHFLGDAENARFRMAEVVGADLQQQQVVYVPVGTDAEVSLHYDHLAIALGSVTRMPPVPGLKEHGFEMKSLNDGINMRDRGIRLLEIANTVSDKAMRQEILRVVVVGSNFTGIEFAGEFQDFMTDAVRSYPNVDRDDVQMVLLEFSDRILSAIDADLADYARKHLERRGLDIRTKTTITEVHEGLAVLTTGEKIATHTVVWCAGIAPNPLLSRIQGLPCDEKGYIECEPDLRVKGFENVWAVGDLAKVLDADGKPYAATAQNATREGTYAGKNIGHAVRGEATEPFQYNPVGALAALGCRTAVAKVMGIKVSGFLAWWMYRTVYLMKMPSWSRRIRIILDWTVDLFFPREPVQLGIRRADPTHDEVFHLERFPKVKDKAS
jgi:NADH:ubiquinone reductase (H+-translocating)